MTEWLTTGQMIDRLKVGEIAESKSKLYRLSKSIMGGIGPVKDPEENVYINGFFVDEKWRILPKYVNFEEAMKAIKNGYHVYFYPAENECLNASLGHTLSWFNRYSWENLIKGKWTIEE